MGGAHVASTDKSKRQNMQFGATDSGAHKESQSRRRNATDRQTDRRADRQTDRPTARKHIER